eukprot:9567372-Karenia_brevis.AAC.1
MGSSPLEPCDQLLFSPLAPGVDLLTTADPTGSMVHEPCDQLLRGHVISTKRWARKQRAGHAPPVLIGGDKVFDSHTHSNDVQHRAADHASSVLSDALTFCVATENVLQQLLCPSAASSSADESACAAAKEWVFLSA